MLKTGQRHVHPENTSVLARFWSRFCERFHKSGSICIPPCPTMQSFPISSLDTHFLLTATCKQPFLYRRNSPLHPTSDYDYWFYKEAPFNCVKAFRFAFLFSRRRRSFWSHETSLAREWKQKGRERAAIRPSSFISISLSSLSTFYELAL